MQTQSQMNSESQMNIVDLENKAITKQLILGNVNLPQDILSCVYSFAFQDKNIYARKKKYSKMLTDTFQNIFRECGGPGIYPGHWTIYCNRIPTEEERGYPNYIIAIEPDESLQLQGVSCIKCGNYIFHNIYDFLDNHNNKYLYCHCQNEGDIVRNQYQLGQM